MTMGDGAAFEHDLIIFQTDRRHSLEKDRRADGKGNSRISPACRSLPCSTIA
jgi:hypothetical protein